MKRQTQEALRQQRQWSIQFANYQRVCSEVDSQQEAAKREKEAVKADGSKAYERKPFSLL